MESADNKNKIRTPIAWLPAGLISWYAPGGAPLALVTSWVALIGGERPSLRTAWHGHQDPLARFWLGGDFVYNVPHDVGLDQIRDVMRQGKLCLNAGDDLGLDVKPGLAALAPLLSGCAVQLECVQGRLVEAGADSDLCGEVVRLHRGTVVLSPADVPEFCAIQPLSPMGQELV